VESERGSTRTAWILVGLFVGALLLRLPGLDGQLWFDEVWMLVDFVRKPVHVALTGYPTDNHHPLYTLLAWMSVRVFGEHPWSLRLFACVFGAASVVTLYAFAREVAGVRESIGARTALFASALLALSPHHVFFSQDARGYTAMLFFTLVASRAFLERRAIVQGAALGLAAYAHLTGAFVAVGQLLIWAWTRRKDKTTSVAPLAGVLIGGALALALHAPMLPDMWRFFFVSSSPYAASSEWKSPLWTIAETARSLGFGLVPGLVALAIGAAIGWVGLRRIWKADREAALLCVVPVVLCALTLVLMRRNLWPRSFFFAAGFGALVAAEGLLSVLDRLAERARLGRFASPAATAFAGLALVALAARLPAEWERPKQDFEGARNFVQAARSDGESALTVGLASFPYSAYYGGGFTEVDSTAELDAALLNSKGAWVITTFPIYLRSRRPELAAELDRRGAEIVRFPGSVGDGDVVVLRVR
jgi:mannosyltransferase